MNCRHCDGCLEHVFLDLGTSPISNAYLSVKDLAHPEAFFPLRLFVCERCWLVQTEDFVRAEDLFVSDYAYFSSVSETWVRHAQRFVGEIRNRLSLKEDSFVIEVASNDGYLLRHVVAAGIPCLGIEPTASTAAAAEALGIPVLREFFGRDLGLRLAADGSKADLVVGNNVFAHVPDVNDFTQGLAAVLKPSGTITLEFPHLLRLLEGTQFDTVYHEHFSYFSLHTVERIFERAGLRVWDVECLPTHGGSLRVYGCHARNPRVTAPSVQKVLGEEQRQGLRELATYRGFQTRVDRLKNDLVEFLIGERRAGRVVAGYGAAAKGNTLLNYAGIRRDLLPSVCDAAPSKQGKFLPGSRIPILPPSALEHQRPDVVLILPWNIADEVVSQQQRVRTWGGRFFVAVPRLRDIG